MCVVSMVHDFYNDKFTAPNIATWTTTQTIQPEIDALRKLIAEFREAIAAAKRVDELTAQPDCVDPEKAKLEERVAALEKKLNGLADAAQELLR